MHPHGRTHLELPPPTDHFGPSGETLAVDPVLTGHHDFSGFGIGGVAAAAEEGAALANFVAVAGDGYHCRGRSGESRRMGGGWGACSGFSVVMVLARRGGSTRGPRNIQLDYPVLRHKVHSSGRSK